LGRLSEYAIHPTDGSVRTETAGCTFETSSPVCWNWEILLSKTNFDGSLIGFYFDISVNLLTIVAMVVKAENTPLWESIYCSDCRFTHPDSSRHSTIPPQKAMMVSRANPQ
jgi:hypothetical protein